MLELRQRIRRLTGGRDLREYSISWNPETQKPEGILRRIISASSNPGDQVLDFFAGSGTTGAVCQELGRDCILIDNNPQAIEVMKKRLKEACYIWSQPQSEI